MWGHNRQTCTKISNRGLKMWRENVKVRVELLKRCAVLCGVIFDETFFFVLYFEMNYFVYENIIFDR